MTYRELYETATKKLNNSEITLGEYYEKMTEPLDEEVRIKGHWISGDSKCPICGEDKFKDLEADIWADWQPNFCPNCGADMRGK